MIDINTTLEKAMLEHGSNDRLVLLAFFELLRKNHVKTFIASGGGERPPFCPSQESIMGTKSLAEFMKAYSYICNDVHEPDHPLKKDLMNARKVITEVLSELLPKWASVGDQESASMEMTFKRMEKLFGKDKT